MTAGNEDFMKKKRNCRRTADESAIHDKAVKMRKMTDEQLVHYMEEIAEKARIEGYNRGKREGSEQKSGGFDPAEFIEGIGNIHGIGQKVMAKIRAYAQEGGYVH